MKDLIGKRTERGFRKSGALVLLFMIMAFVFTACGGSQKSSKYVGKWISTSYEMSGMKLDGGADTNLILNADGKGKLTLMGQGADITWKETDQEIVLKSGLTGVYKLPKTGDTIVLNESGMKVTFAREGAAAGGSTTAKAAAAATKAAAATTAAKQTAATTKAAATAAKQTTAAATTKAAAATTAAKAASASGSPFMGYWRLTTLTDNTGKRVEDMSEFLKDDPDLKEAGDVMQLEFHDQGLVYYGLLGMGLKGTWKETGADSAEISVADGNYTLKLVGKELQMHSSDGETYFLEKASGSFDMSIMADFSGSDETGGSSETTAAPASAKTGNMLMDFIPGTWVGYDPADQNKVAVVTLLIYGDQISGNVCKGYLMTGDAQISYFFDATVVDQKTIKITPTSDTSKKEGTYGIVLDGNGKGMTWSLTGGDQTVKVKAFHLEKVE